MKIRWLLSLLLVFLFTCCQGPAAGPPQPDPSPPGPSPAGKTNRGREPIDRKAGRLILTRHARCRMDCRHITEKEIREVLENGEIDYRKSEPNGRPDPKYALEGTTQEGQYLRIVFAVPGPDSREAGALIVVTCIELGVEWQCDCR
ncbi:MAG: DUF4258 domain-containing protein [Puia sp.]|nr:DUF4258 domain-containing protein [Puia sp.]